MVPDCVSRSDRRQPTALTLSLSYRLSNTGETMTSEVGSRLFEDIFLKSLVPFVLVSKGPNSADSGPCTPWQFGSRLFDVP